MKRPKAGDCSASSSAADHTSEAALGYQLSALRPTRPVRARQLNRRSFSATVGPKRKQLDSLGIVEQTVVEKMPDARKVYAANVGQIDIDGTRTYARLERDEPNRSLELLPNRVWRLCSIDTPPDLEPANLLCSAIADLDGQGFSHSRLRISRSSASAVIFSPRSHCAIDSRRTAFSSGVTSNRSSSSSAMRVTCAPSGSSPSKTTCPSTTLPEVIFIWRFYSSGATFFFRSDGRSTSAISSAQTMARRLTASPSVIVPLNSESAEYAKMRCAGRVPRSVPKK